MDSVNQDKVKLINFFWFLLDGEVSKPLGEMNSEAVENYIKILLYLQNKNAVLSSDFINEQVRKIFHPEDYAAPETAKVTKKRINKKKIWLIAACISILIALFSIISFSTERGVIDTLEEYFGTFEFIPFDKKVTVNDETYIKNSPVKNYTTVEDCAEAEKTNFLFPANMKNSVDLISADQETEERLIYFRFGEDTKTMNITFNAEMDQGTIDMCQEVVTIGGIEYHLCIMEDVNLVQAYFVYENNLYSITYPDKDTVMEMINNMVEIKYEN